MKIKKFVYLLMGLLFLASLYPIKVLSSPRRDLVGTLQQQSGGTARISYHAETGLVRFIGVDPEHAIAQPRQLERQATPEEAAQVFLSQYGTLFGVSNPAEELTVMKSAEFEGGRSMVRYQQVYKGIPVFGGELIVNMDASKKVLSANGEILPGIGVSTVPRLDAKTAQGIALQAVAKSYTLDADSLQASNPELWIFNPALLGGAGPRITSLVWRMEVSGKEVLPLRELVLVDAQLGVVALHFNQNDAILNRTVYDNQNQRNENLALYPPVCTEGNCPGSGDHVLAYTYGGDTYNFYYTNYGRDSIDGAGMALISTVRYCPTNTSYACPYANAFWNGAQMVYGQGFASADDVVAHEMTHGVTEHESHLFYYMQSGAINEAFSDIWGEFVDLSNTGGDDSPSVRWLMGEDIGAIRSMKNPTVYGDPDRMGSSYYVCDENDQGGVHSNSGVANKAAYLMVDGDTFNGYTVTGLGITKVAKIFYEVQTHLFTSASDYQDLYDGLLQACSTLKGSYGITDAECQEVKDAVDAVEMNQQPASCATTEAPVCPSGQVANNIFFDNLENPASGNWLAGAVTGLVNQFFYPQTSNPYNFDVTYATSGVYNFWGYNIDAVGDYAIAMTLNAALPAGSTPYLHFKHAYAFENGRYDGGVLEYSTNGGGSWNDAGSLFEINGYNGTISSSYGNPLGSRSAFVNRSHGYGSSRLNLSTLAGQNVRFRFRIGTDSSVDNWGWFIDDVRIYTCGAATPTPTKTATPVGWTPLPTRLSFIPIVRKGRTATPTATITPTFTPTFTPSPTPPPGSGPTAGFWQQTGSCAGCSEFYVTTGTPQVDNFAIYISVSGCGNYKITRLTEYPIVNNVFSFTGTFYASGTFYSATGANITYGLNSYYIYGCGYVTGGPFDRQAAWVNSNQAPPDFQAVSLVAPDSGAPDFIDPNTVIEFLGK